MENENIMENPVYAILDLETTGLSRKRDRIVQIACLKVGKDDSQTTWMRYVNPRMDNEYLQEAFRIHHIAPEFLQKKTPFEEIVESFCSFLKDVDIIVAHNCVYDWDMLCREFEILDDAKKTRNDSSKEEFAKSWWGDFHSKYKWLDTLRLAMICFPKRNTYRLGAIKDLLNIDPQQQTTGKLSTEGDYGGDQWKPHQHDAMYDVLTTYGVLQHCMKSSFHALVQDFPMAILDTSLFLDMQRLLNENKTSNEDLLPFATRSKEYFTTSRPKGKKLGTLSKSFLQMSTNSLKADTRADDRIILIYEAAFLEPLDNEEIAPSLSKTKEDSGKGKDCGSPKQEEAAFLEPLDNEEITPSLSKTKEDSGKGKDCGSPKQNEDGFLGPLNNVQIIPSLSTTKEDSEKETDCGSLKQDEDYMYLTCSTQKRPKLSLE